MYFTLYYAVNHELIVARPHFHKLWTQFTSSGPQADAFRKERWKVIPRIAEGSWIVQKSVGAKPALLAQKLDHTWILCNESGTDLPASAPNSPPRGVKTADTGCEPNLRASYRARGRSVEMLSGIGPYLEADCDVMSSSMAFMLVSLMHQYAKNIVIDLGFCIEPREDAELPEVVLGTFKLSRVDTNKIPIISKEETDWPLGSPVADHLPQARD
jgi:hypothetical protein